MVYTARKFSVNENNSSVRKPNVLINRHLALEHNPIFHITKKIYKEAPKFAEPLEERADDEHSFDTTRRNYYANFRKTWRAANSKFPAEYFTRTNGRNGSLIIQGSWCPCDLRRNPDSMANTTLPWEGWNKYHQYGLGFRFVCHFVLVTVRLYYCSYYRYCFFVCGVDDLYIVWKIVGSFLAIVCSLAVINCLTCLCMNSSHNFCTI